MNHAKSLGKSNKGRPCPEHVKKLNSKLFSGSNSNSWKGGLTPLWKLLRGCFQYRQWRCDVFQRDDYICQKCGERGGTLEAHHKKSFIKILRENSIKIFDEAIQCSELWNINNGQTLCKKCHKMRGVHARA